MIITKASGDKVDFSHEKLYNSLKHSGADDSTIDQVMKKVEEQLYDGISTRKIYKLAFKLLKGEPNSYAAKYKLKKGIMELGPSGFPFEKFVAEILHRNGYSTKIGEIKQGHCITHEVDILAEKDNLHCMIECKYHNSPGFFCNIKIALYIQARFEDLDKIWKLNAQNETKIHKAWIATNTKFSYDVIKYANCMGLTLLGWDYPVGNSLKDQIDKFKLYPLTCLTSITKSEKQILLNNNNVLCIELYNQPQLLNVIPLSNNRKEIIFNEIKSLCQ